MDWQKSIENGLRRNMPVEGVVIYLMTLSIGWVVRNAGGGPCFPTWIQRIFILLLGRNGRSHHQWYAVMSSRSHLEGFALAALAFEYETRVWGAVPRGIGGPLS